MQYSCRSLVNLRQIATDFVTKGLVIAPKICNFIQLPCCALSDICTTEFSLNSVIYIVFFSLRLSLVISYEILGTRDQK